MKKVKITNIELLKFAKKAQRETTHLVKPIIYTDKKKKNNKEFCRTNKGYRINAKD